MAKITKSIEAMRARRAYAATDRIICEFWLGKAFMGEEFSASGCAHARIRFEGTGRIKQVMLLRDSEPWREWTPHGTETDIQFALSAEDIKGHYFYVRMMQEDSNLAWSSPIWVD
ncbi:MAG: hypothetical protein ACLFWL_10070 [Candidatus Brocadiia bacterium]